MRRTVTLVSAMLTAFTVVLVGAVVYGYRVNARPESAPELVVGQPGPSAELIAASSMPTNRISATQAAATASEFLQRTDAYSVQLVEYNGAQAYKVRFLSGDVVYVSLDGKVLGSELPTVQLASTGGQREEDARDGSSVSFDGEGEHEHEAEQQEPQEPQEPQQPQEPQEPQQVEGAGG